MLKGLLYLGITVIAAVLSLVSPLFGGMASCLIYLLNPSAIQMSLAATRYQLIITAAFAIGWVLHRPRGVPRCGREGYVLFSFWAFVAVIFLSASWAVVSGNVSLVAGYEVFKTVFVATLLITVIHDERGMSGMVTVLIIGAWHAAALHVLGGRFGYISPSAAREFGVLPDSQTAVMVLFVPLLVACAVAGSGKQRILACVALPFVLDSVVGTYERTGLVSLTVEAVLLFVICPRRIKRRLLPGLALAGALFVFRLTPDTYWSRMKTIQTPAEEASARTRLVVNQASLRMFLDYPWGVGYRNYPDVSPRYLSDEYLTEGRRSAHNSYFTVLCETGIPGFLAWAGGFCGAVVLLRRIRKSTGPDGPNRIQVYALGLEVGLYGWMAGGLTQAYHEVDPAYWFAALAIVLYRLHEQTLEETTPEAPAADQVDAAHA